MPAGNDGAAAYQELTDKFGAGHGRAEDLIQARRDAYPTELRAAQLKELDANATALLEDAEVADAAGVKTEQIESAAVRGDDVIAVISDSTGRTSKVVLPLSTFGMEPDEDTASAVVFASDAAEEAAEAKGLTAETIARYVPEGSGKNGSYTTADVKVAAEAKAAE